MAVWKNIHIKKISSRDATNLCVDKTSHDADIYSQEIDRAVLVIAANNSWLSNVENVINGLYQSHFVVANKRTSRSMLSFLIITNLFLISVETANVVLFVLEHTFRWTCRGRWWVCSWGTQWLLLSGQSYVVCTKPYSPPKTIILILIILSKDF